MSAAVRLLDRLHRRGAVVSLDGDCIRVNGPRGLLTEELRVALLSCKQEVVGLLSGRVWDSEAADDVIRATLDRVSAAYDVLPPGCSVGGPGWDEAEAQVDAACATRNLPALLVALSEYETLAETVFGEWRSAREAA